MCVCVYVCVCVKLPSRDLNSDFYPLHSIITYTCRVTIAPRVYNDIFNFLDK